MPTISELRTARERIKSFIHRTPLIHSNSFSTMAGADVYVKAENLQKTGSFKVRGVFNKISGLNADKVATASMGNHAQALAYAANRLGIKARIIMPRTRESLGKILSSIKAGRFVVQQLAPAGRKTRWD